jgi:hypothetical protein
MKSRAAIRNSENAGHVATDSRDDNDTLHVLPLSLVPLATPGLQRARMIKDPQLHSVVELFRDEKAGSGHIPPDKLKFAFDTPGEEFDADVEMISQLALLNSYDVYSLRIELRRLKIPINDFEALKLSHDKQRELTEYMRVFTRPLIRQLYGDDELQVDDMDGLVGLFKSPDRERVVLKIVQMAEQLQVAPAEVPEFLEDYGDVFLSLAYYRDIVDKLMIRIERFTDSMAELLRSQQIRNDPRISDTCLNLDNKFSEIASWIAGRFESFDRNSERLWDDINADSFARMKTIITGHYTTIGGMLCGLQVKMDAWEERFPEGKGGLLSKADFVMSEFRQGIGIITEIQANAPPIAD